MTNIEITAPDAEYLEIREMFRTRGEHGGQMPAVQIYADRKAKERKPLCYWLFLLVVAVGILAAVLTLFEVLKPWAGFGVVAACTLAVMVLRVPGRMS